jgi:DNA polymerase-3 subunit epsilon
MDSWVAIDFETASIRGTPCAVGLIEVVDGTIGESAKWLIRPPLFEFSPFNIALHGVTPAMCEGAPSWSESLDRIDEFRRGRPLVAHNAAFDLGVIRDACEIAETPWPSLSYACTLVVSRRVWPGLATYSLPFLASHLGVPSDVRHDPLADARMTAAVGCLALEKTENINLAELLTSIKALMGSMTAGEWAGCRLRDVRAAIPDMPSPGAEPNADHPLYGKTVAFTGALSIPRREAQQAIVDCGAVAGKGVTRKTDMLVTGIQDLTKLAAGKSRSAKLLKAEQLVAEGRMIEIVAEGDFVKLLAQ